MLGSHPLSLWPFLRDELSRFYPAGFGDRNVAASGRNAQIDGCPGSWASDSGDTTSTRHRPRAVNPIYHRGGAARDHQHTDHHHARSVLTRFCGGPHSNEYSPEEPSGLQLRFMLLGTRVLTPCPRGWANSVALLTRPAGCCTNYKRLFGTTLLVACFQAIIVRSNPSATAAKDYQRYAANFSLCSTRHAAQFHSPLAPVSPANDFGGFSAVPLPAQLDRGVSFRGKQPRQELVQPLPNRTVRLLTPLRKLGSKGRERDE